MFDRPAGGRLPAGTHHRRITVALALALAGVTALEGGGSFSSAGLGDLLVLAGVLSAAAYTIVARGMGDESHSAKRFAPLTPASPT